jgi:hypothetical protein
MLSLSPLAPNPRPVWVRKLGWRPVWPPQLCISADKGFERLLERLPVPVAVALWVADHDGGSPSPSPRKVAAEHMHGSSRARRRSADRIWRSLSGRNSLT